MALIFLDPFPRTEAMVYTPETAERLAAMGTVVTHFGSRAPDGLVDDLLPDVAVIVGQTAMPAERLDRAEKLLAIVNVKANWEPNIDYAGAQARGVQVLTVAPGMAPAVAEFCLGQAITLGRGLAAANRRFREGQEAYGSAGNGEARSLFGATVGLVGFGNLGRALLPLLAPFGCDTQVFDPWLSPGYLRSLDLRPVGLDALLASSQFIFLLAGVTTENQGFLSRDKLATITPGTSVVLASRAEIVDFDALLDLAGQGRIRAAIDVFPEEPVPADAATRQTPDVVFSAHLAGGLEASYQRIRDMMVDDIGQILKGLPPLWTQRADPGLAARMRSR